jgi:hypothetical protein
MHFDNYIYFQLFFHVAVTDIYCVDIKKTFNFYTISFYLMKQLKLKKLFLIF